MLTGLYCIKLPGTLILLFKVVCRACYTVIGIQLEILKTLTLGVAGRRGEDKRGLLERRRIGKWLTGLNVLMAFGNASA